MFLGTMATAALTPGVVIAQSSKSMMKANVVHDYGGPEVLKYASVNALNPKRIRFSFG